MCLLRKCGHPRQGFRRAVQECPCQPGEGGRREAQSALLWRLLRGSLAAGLEPRRQVTKPRRIQTQEMPGIASEYSEKNSSWIRLCPIGLSLSMASFAVRQTEPNRIVQARSPAMPSCPALQSHTSDPEIPVTAPANIPQAPARSAHSTVPATLPASPPPAPGTTLPANPAADRHASRKSCTPPHTPPARCESVGIRHTQLQRLKKTHSSGGLGPIGRKFL